MKKTTKKVITSILAALIVFLTSIPAFAASNAATTINSNYLFEASTLDSLKLNLQALPTIKVSGISDNTYTIKDDNKLWWWNTTAVTNRRIEFNDIGFDKAIPNLTLEVTYENAGTLNGKAVDLILTYSNFWSASETNSERFDTKTLWWTAYGTPEQQNGNNEWFMVGFDKFNLNIQFKYHDSDFVFFDNAYFTLYSMDGTVENNSLTHAEAASASGRASQTYWYEQRNMNCNVSWSNGKYSENDLYYGTKSHSNGRDTKNAVCFQYQNRRDIDLDMLVIGGKWSEGYHVNFTPLTAIIPKPPTKEISATRITAHDDVKYTISQTLPKAYDDIFTLSSMSLSDTLDNSIEYVSACILDSNNSDITRDAGKLTYSPLTQSVEYVFNSEYLKHADYNGSEIKFIINTKAKDKISSAVISNYATTKMNDTEIELTSNRVEATVYYPITVNYVDESGTQLAETIKFDKNVGENYTTHLKTIPNYELVAEPINASGTVIDAAVTVDYIYRLKSTSVIANYLDEDGNKLADSVAINGKVFDAYNTQEKAIYGYELVAAPENASGEMTEDAIIVNYIYKLKNSLVTANYVDEAGNKLADSETITGKVFDDYTTFEKVIYGYKLTAVPINATGIMKEKQIVVNYVYTKAQSSVVANYVDENGNQLAESEFLTGNVNDAYLTEAKTIYGYELISVPENAKGIIAEKTTIVDYVYKLKSASVIVNYIDEDGNKLADSEAINGKVFDAYNTQEKDIDGYVLRDQPENASGTMQAEQIVVNYVYAKEVLPVATAPEIKSPKTGAGKLIKTAALIAVFSAASIEVLLFTGKKKKTAKQYNGAKWYN